MRIPKILILEIQEGFLSDIVHLSYGGCEIGHVMRMGVGRTVKVGVLGWVAKLYSWSANKVREWKKEESSPLVEEAAKIGLTLIRRLTTDRKG